MLQKAFFLFCFSLTALLPASAKGFDPYEALHLSKTATSEEIQNAFQEKLKESGLTPDEIVTAYYSFSILNHPENRKQYDQNEPITLSVPLADRKKMEEMLKTISPKELSSFRKTGKVAEHMVAGAATFYLAMAITTSRQCLQNNNPVYCREFLKDLTNPAAESGFAAFILSAHFATNALKSPLSKVFSASTAGSLANLGGAAVGSLASDVVGDLMNKPEFQALFHLDTIPDEAQRSKVRNQLIHQIWSTTGGDQDWWLNKAPEVASLLTSSIVAQQTAALAAQAAKDCRFPQFIRTLFTGQGLTGPKKWLQKKSSMLARMVLFLEYEKLLRPVIQGGWDHLTLEKNLKKSREKFLPSSDGKSGIQTVFEISPSAIQENGKLWDQYVQKQLEPFEELTMISKINLLEYDKEIDKVGSFYNWFFDGATNDGTYAQNESWKRLQKYLPKNASLADAKKEAEPYLRAFFFGPDFHHALKDTDDWHGLPVPGSQSPQVQAFRVAESADPALKNASFETLLKEIKKEKYKAGWLMDDRTGNEGIGGQFRVFAETHRQKRVNAFEKGLTDHFLETLKGANGVLPSLILELGDLDLALKNVRSKEIKNLIEARKTEVLDQKAEVEKLIQYYTQPIGQRFHEPDPSNEGSKMKFYFKSFIMPDESHLL